MYISIQTKQAYTEIDNFIELLTEEDRNKIPKRLRQFFKEEKDKNYIKKIDVDIPIKNQNLKEETLALIALLNIKYICNDDKEKDRLTKIYSENDIKYQKNLKKQYYDNIFSNRKNNIQAIDEEVTKETAIIKYKQKNFIQKIFDKIKHLLFEKGR